jgi:hypothetical protein
MRKTPLLLEGRFCAETNTIECLSSGLEHFSEGPEIRRQGERSDPMPLRRRFYFRLHSERAEEYRLCSSLLDGFHEIVSAIGMITVNDYGTRFFPEDYILDRLRLSEKSRLQTPELYQHAQQRRDDFLARENQHRAQRKPAERS